jgi:hypothetical protein
LSGQIQEQWNLHMFRNIFCWIDAMGVNLKNDAKYYISEHGNHWNIEGHREVAKLIENFINEKHDI